jgi:cell division septum initiation protein DivIVA
MIANNIDGSSGNGSQILDLLALVAADPKVYQSKLKELQDAADRNQKYVEAIGPVSDIIILRQQAQADTDAAAQALKEAKEQADAMVKEARASADAITDKARIEADAVKEQATIATNEASALLSQAQQAKTSVDKAQRDAESAIATAQVKAEQLDQAIADAQTAKAAAEAAKADILAKHEAFIKSL